MQKGSKLAVQKERMMDIVWNVQSSTLPCMSSYKSYSQNGERERERERSIW